jgi:hypothetical protein
MAKFKAADWDAADATSCRVAMQDAGNFFLFNVVVLFFFPLDYLSPNFPHQ